MSEVTQILSRIEQGDAAAADQLLPLVYDELRKLAQAKLATEKPGQTLQATALVHEAYVRLVSDDSSPHWNSRGHFFGAAAEAMRRILVENARSKARLKRGAGRGRVDLDAIDVAFLASPNQLLEPDQLLEIDEALERLKEEDPVVFDLVRLRYFAGLSMDQAADALGVSAATAYRYWRYARAWLHAELLGTPED